MGTHPIFESDFDCLTGPVWPIIEWRPGDVKMFVAELSRAVHLVQPWRAARSFAPRDCGACPARSDQRTTKIAQAITPGLRLNRLFYSQRRKCNHLLRQFSF